MNATHPVGLGEPEPAGKLALFQPPRPRTKKVEVKEEPGQDYHPLRAKPNYETRKRTASTKRVRTTIDLTHEALKIIEGIQQVYRFRTGKVLPLWKAVSQAIEFYGRKKGGGE
jgi:hypothetical protein